MSSRYIDFKETDLAELPAEEKRVEYWDTGRPGMSLRISPTGGRVYYYTVKRGGRVERLRIGRYQDIDLRVARRRAEQLAGDYAYGRNPAADRRKLKRDITLGELWNLYLDQHAKPHKRSWKNDQGRWNTHLATWAARRVNEITRADVSKLLSKITATGRAGAANRVRALLHHMYSWAAKERGLEVANPVADTKRNRERPKSRYLAPEELKGFWAVLEADHDHDTRDFCKLLLLTGVRRGSLEAAEWVEFNLRDRLWRIPGTHTKAGRPLEVALAPSAVEVLEDRQARHADGERYLFPAVTPDREGRRGPIRDGWVRVTKAAKLADLTPHDLRRTWATYAMQAGVALEVVASVLGHTPVGGVTAVYAKIGPDVKRRGVDKVADLILRTAKGDTEPAKVVPHPSAARGGA